MRRNCRSITTSPEIVKHIDGLTEAYFNLLTKLIEWLDAKQETEPKFQSVVVTQLSRIETAISLIQVAVLAQDQRLKFYDADKLNKDAKAAEEFISRQAFESGLAAVKYIYKQEPKPEARHDRRRRWWGWEI